MIEEYRKTLAALEALEEKKLKANADYKTIKMIREEMEEVADTIRHLTKGVSRYKW